jgi:hypothetical protein
LTNSNFTSFWEWFFKGTGAKPGFRRILNLWIFLHLAIGLIVAYLVCEDIKTSANAVLLPLIGIFIGLR